MLKNITHYKIARFYNIGVMAH